MVWYVVNEVQSSIYVMYCLFCVCDIPAAAATTNITRMENNSFSLTISSVNPRIHSYVVNAEYAFPGLQIKGDRLKTNSFTPFTAFNPLSEPG